MEPRLKPIPAFYCCYLLRSTIRHSSLYVGSSPHPSRRLAQHNGKIKGGAVRTSRTSLRPWEMICIVAGFPSNIAALQFEWAWHNAHLTTHIAPEDRLSLPTIRTKTNAKTGKTRKKLGRPRTSLIDKLSNLHLLLQAPYFSKWPLELRFFNENVHRSWLSWNERTPGNINPDIKIYMDLPPELEEDTSIVQQQKRKNKADLKKAGGVHGVDPTYTRCQPVLQKLKQRIDDKSSPAKCDICKQNFDCEKHLFNICLHEACRSLTHVSCLSSYFLRNMDSKSLVPIEGPCPSCKTSLKWSELMTVLSLRMRDERTVTKLLKKRKTSAKAAIGEIFAEEDAGIDLPEDESHLAGHEDVTEDVDRDDSDLNDCSSVMSMESVPSVHQRAGWTTGIQPDSGSSEIVIEDSEDDL